MINLLGSIKNEYKRFRIEREKQMQKLEVKAVYEEDIAPFLDSIGILDTINAGKAECAHCFGIVTLENFLSVYPENGEIKVCCKDTDCYKKLLSKRSL
jgi:hypothetical protein